MIFAGSPSNPQGFPQQLEQQRPEETKLFIYCGFIAICATADDKQLRQIFAEKNSYAVKFLPAKKAQYLRLFRSKPQPVKDLHFLKCGRMLASMIMVRQIVRHWTFRGSLPNPGCCRSLDNKHRFGSPAYHSFGGELPNWGSCLVEGRRASKKPLASVPSRGCILRGCT